MHEKLVTITQEYSPIAEDQRYLDSFLNSIKYLTSADFLEVKATAIFMMKSYRDAGKGPRDDGKPWSSHSLATGEIAAEYKVNLATLQKGLLHDINEDTDLSITQLAQFFGDDVADGVERLSKLKQVGIPYHEKDEILQANLFEAVIDNPGAAFVRFCERLHNLRTIDARFKKDRERAISTCEESLAVYVPLAWRLGLYDIANEMALHSLSLLQTESMAKLEQIVPAFSYDKLTAISRMIVDATELDEKNFRIYLPAYGQLAEALKRRGSIERLIPDDAPQMVDFLIEGSEEASILLHRLVKSGWFDIDAHSLQGYYADLSKGVKERPLYITLRTKSTRHMGEPISIKINFLTAKQIMERRAAIFHLLQAERVEDLDIKDLAAFKIEKERIEIRKLKQMAKTPQVRSKLYEEALARGVMVATIAFPDGHTEKVDVFKKSTVLDVLLQSVHSGKLTFADFIRIREVKIGARRVRLHHTVDALSELYITIHPTVLQLRPDWLRALNTTIPEQRSIISQELRKLIDAGRVDIKEEAEALGEDIISEEFRRIQHIELKLKVIRGFNDNLRRKYPDESDFLVAVGIGEVDPTVIHAVVNRIGEYRDSLVHITVLVPRGYDQYGWEANCAEVLRSHHISIAESTNGQKSRSGIDAFLSYLFEPAGKSREELIQLGQIIAASCKNLFDLPELPKVEVVIPSTPNGL